MDRIFIFLIFKILYIYIIMESIFTDIYENCIWGDNPTNEYSGSSGGGSEYNETYSNFLKDFIKNNNIKSIIDLGSGDFQSGNELYKDIDVEYTGYDVYKKVVDYNNKKYKNKYNFIHLDFCNKKEDLQTADLCIIKDVLQHWETKHIYEFLDYITQKKLYKYILLINCCNQNTDNIDVVDQFRDLSCSHLPLKKYNPVKLLNYSTKEISVIKNDLVMFCIYHKNYYVKPDNFYFTFYAVNDVYPKKKIENHIYEYELDYYDPLLQKRGYMETSVYIHVYKNKLYKNRDFVGFSHYDMKHNEIYNNLDKNTIYLFYWNKEIVKNGKWCDLMFSDILNFDFVIDSYNKHFNKNYSIKELENQPCSLSQTNIYPVKIFEKLGSWLEKLVYEIYPWAYQKPYQRHFGSLGGFTERCLTIFNAFEIYEGIKYAKLSIELNGNPEEVKEHYGISFFNDYCQDIHCKIVETDDEGYTIVGSNDEIIKKNKDGITELFHKNISKQLMLIGNSSNDKFKWNYNILKCNLDDYQILYKKINNENFLFRIL